MDKKDLPLFLAETIKAKRDSEVRVLFGLTSLAFKLLQVSLIPYIPC
jgi:hypothetical protein